MQQPHPNVPSQALRAGPFDRAIRLAGLLNASDRVPAWQRARAAISDSIQAHGWNDALNAYTQA